LRVQIPVLPNNNNNKTESWHDVNIPVIPALRMWRQEDLEFQDSLGYIVRPYLKNQKIKEGRKEGLGDWDARGGHRGRLQ
jgi:hypothetical protein